MWVCGCVGVGVWVLGGCGRVGVGWVWACGGYWVGVGMCVLGGCGHVHVGWVCLPQESSNVMCCEVALYITKLFR